MIVAAAGSLPGDLQRVWRNRAENTYHVEYGYSCMGYEVNAALGVKRRSRRAKSTPVGDGSFMMLHSELVTSLQERAKINVVLFDNMANGCINNLQMEHGWTASAPSSATVSRKPASCRAAPVPVDFATIAAGYGCKTSARHYLDELRHALDAARRETVSTLIDIKVLPKTMVHKYGSWWNVGSPRRRSLNGSARWRK